MASKSDWAKTQGEIFKKAYKRATRAINSGFYLEAVSLAESLILNRLEVILRSSEGIEYDKFSVGKAINTLISHKAVAFDESLWVDCAAWSRKRNSLSHHFARVELGGDLNWRGRISFAQEVATEGLKIANRCSLEARKHRL